MVCYVPCMVRFVLKRGPFCPGRGPFCPGVVRFVRGPLTERRRSPFGPKCFITYDTKVCSIQDRDMGL